MTTFWFFELIKDFKYPVKTHVQNTITLTYTTKKKKYLKKIEKYLGYYSLSKILKK